MAVIWGIPYLLIKVAIGELTPAGLVFLRTAIGAGLLLPVAAARGWLAPLIPYWRWVLVYTIVEVSLPWFLLADGERRLSSSLTGLLIAAVPLIAAALQLLTRGDDRLDRRRVTGPSRTWARSLKSAWLRSATRAGRSLSPARSPACPPWASLRHRWY